MEITFLDRLEMRLAIYRQIVKMPSIKHAWRLLVNPIDSVRDVEFCYLIKCLKNVNCKPSNVLDISSPFILAYVLSSDSTVVKTDINPAEQDMIRESNNLHFKLEDGTSLSFGGSTFDLVYSISVIEHIYQNYAVAVKEMIRVLKPGGYLYLTFPVAQQHVEEWLDHKAYPAQYEKAGKAFFQYRFDEDDINNLLAELTDTDVIDLSVYWERTKGKYDMVMNKLRQKPMIKHTEFLRNGIVNLYATFALMENRPNSFSHDKLFGNASLLLRKKHI